MLLQFVLTGLGGLLILIVCEALIRSKTLKGEYARKLVHIAISVYAASWAFYLNRQTIILISIILFLAVLITQKFHILKSMQSVKRVTYGELYYPLGIGLSAFLFREPAIYAIAVLHMGLADGFAAIVGVSMANKAKKFRYRGALKTLEGSLTFAFISFTLNMLYWFFFVNDTGLFVPTSAIIYSISCAAMLAVTEIISPRGSDNVIIPLFAGILLLLPQYSVGTATLFGFI